MIRKLKLVLGVLAMSAAAPALAQDSLLEYVVNSCEADIKQYCSQVTPGEGRLLPSPIRPSESTYSPP